MVIGIGSRNHHQVLVDLSPSWCATLLLRLRIFRTTHGIRIVAEWLGRRLFLFLATLRFIHDILDTDRLAAVGLIALVADEGAGHKHYNDDTYDD